MSTTPVSVSVVVPAFQAAPFLEEAVASIRAQTHPVQEVVVVDDGSTDETLAVARDLAAGWPAMRVLTQPNGGPSAARNAGLGVATGDLITFLDADDRMVHERVALQVDHLRRRPEVDIVFGQKSDELETGVDAPVSHAARPRGARPDCVLTMMVRREVFSEVGGFDPGRRLSEEYEWLSRAQAAGRRFSVLDHVLIRRRLHGGNLTQAVPAAIMDTQLLAILRARIGDRRSTA